MTQGEAATDAGFTWSLLSVSVLIRVRPRLLRPPCIPTLSSGSMEPGMPWRALSGCRQRGLAWHPWVPADPLAQEGSSAAPHPPLSLAHEVPEATRSGQHPRVAALRGEPPAPCPPQTPALHQTHPHRPALLRLETSPSAESNQSCLFRARGLGYGYGDHTSQIVFNSQTVVLLSLPGRMYLGGG